MSVILAGCGKVQDVSAESKTSEEFVTIAESETQSTEPETEEPERAIEESVTIADEPETATEKPEPTTEESPEIPQERKDTMTKFHEIHRNAVAGYVESEAEKKIVSYLQVPADFVVDPTWSGDWSHLECAGREFSSFGCGICCLANIYDTILTPSDPVTPDEMFTMTREQTDYNPESGVGAVSWGQLKKMCTNFGLFAEVKTKPAEYAEFQNDVSQSRTTLVLVCKRDDDKLWFYTNGHYVNLWEYDEATDTVFVTDASGLFNRARVKLPDVYNALKSASSAQYMTVQGPAPQKVEGNAANEEQ